MLNAGIAISLFIQNITSSAKKYSLRLDVMGASDEGNRWGDTTLPNDFIGCFKPTSGLLKSEKVVKAYRELAELHRAAKRTNSRVRDISIRDDSVTIKTDGQTFHSDALVVSAGAVFLVLSFTFKGEKK